MAVSDTQMLANIALERAVIRHAFPGNDVSAALAETVWATLSDKLLYFPESLAVWAYAQRLQEESSSFPSWGEIISAQVLLPYADYLRHAAVASFVSIEQVTRACRTLRDLSQRRMMQNQATRLSQAACDMSLPLSTVLDTAADVANVAVSEGSSDGTDRFVFDGKHNTGVQELTKWLIDPKRVPSVLRTGLTDFDEACGGFPDTGVVLLGATTSSGKSVMAKQIGLNMVRSYMGMRVSMVTLEMSREQEFTRTMSNLAEIDGQHLARNNLTDDERAYLEQVALEFANECGKNNSAIDVWSPDEDDVGIDACLRHFKATGARVGMIDYTGLLAGEAGAETQAISLSMIVRKAKVFSKRTNKLIVLLVQVDDKSHALRYAQAMREHADVLAVWFPNEAEKLLGQWMVYIKKNRHSVIGKFPTTWDMKYSKVVASGKYRPGDVSEELLAGGESDAAEDEDSKKSSSARAARVSNAGAYSGAKGAK